MLSYSINKLEFEPLLISFDISPRLFYNTKKDVVPDDENRNYANHKCFTPCVTDVYITRRNILKAVCWISCVILFLGTKSHVAQNTWDSFDAWEAHGGCWEMKDSIIYGRGDWGFCKFLYQKEFTDFVIKVRLAKVEESGGYSVLFRYDDRKDCGYHLFLFPFSTVVFSKLRSDVNEYLYEGNSVYWQQGFNVWNTVTIESSGTRFDITVNDHHLFTFRDNEFSSGNLGLSVGGDTRQKAKFEILEIREK